MKVAVFSTKSYDKDFFEKINQHYNHDLFFFEERLTERTLPLAKDFPAVCTFVNDHLHAEVLEALSKQGTKLAALRCAGFNNVDLKKAHELNLMVVRVPAYSPHSVAEHTLGLMLALNRKYHRAYNRVREGNFSLDGLLGFDMHKKTIGLIGLGNIGCVTAQLMNGFGGEVLAYDPYPPKDPESHGAKLVELDELFNMSDIISLHCPLVPDTHHMINKESINKMQNGVMLINTSRGALINTIDVIEALKTGKIGYLGLDVYEEEADLFFSDLSNQVIQDDVFARLLTFPNVLITGHQAFFTRNALENIAETTLNNIRDVEEKGICKNEVTLQYVAKG